MILLGLNTKLPYFSRLEGHGFSYHPEQPGKPWAESYLPHKILQ